MAPMDNNASTANRFNELPTETQDFLSQLREEDIETLKDGIRLVTSIRIVGTFVKWLLVGVLGMVAGIVMFSELVFKILGWFRQ